MAENFGTHTPPVEMMHVDHPMHPVRLGIIGCGYVTAGSHLPASQLSQDVEVVALADVRSDLAGSFAEQYHVPFVTADYKTIFDKVDAVIVALPHHLHAKVALEFLDRGIHVLVEKPMATSTWECQQMIAAAKASGSKLAVGLMRRFYDSSRLVKRMIDAGFLGKILRFEAREAVLFDRFAASAFTVLPPYGGVLLDTGPHCLDLLLWWLGDFERIGYWDDALGGVEANCKIEITTVQGVPGVVELSRTRNVENKIRLVCERGVIDFCTHFPDQVMLESVDFSGTIQMSKVSSAEDPHPLLPYFSRQLANFSGSILRDDPLEIPGEEGMRSVAVIERCRQVGQPIDVLPWDELNQGVIQKAEL